MAKSKVQTVMHEFKAGKLKSSSGQKVTNPKQAVAIAISEARRASGGKSMKKMAMGGAAAPTGNALFVSRPASGAALPSRPQIVRNRPVGLQPQRGRDMRMASGGTVGSASKRADGIAQRGKTRGKVI